MIKICINRECNQKAITNKKYCIIHLNDRRKKWNKYMRDYRKDNPEFFKKQWQKDYKNRKPLTEEQKEKKRKEAKIYYRENKERISKYYKERYKNKKRI